MNELIGTLGRINATIDRINGRMDRIEATMTRIEREMDATLALAYVTCGAAIVRALVVLAPP